MKSVPSSPTPTTKSASFNSVCNFAEPYEAYTPASRGFSELTQPFAFGVITIGISHASASSASPWLIAASRTPIPATSAGRSACSSRSLSRSPAASTRSSSSATSAAGQSVSPTSACASLDESATQTGPIIGAVAVSHARSSRSAQLLAYIRSTSFDTGRNSSSRSTFMCVHSARSASLNSPISSSTGVRSSIELAIPFTMFVAPGPTVHRHTAGRSASCASASAMWAAKVSWCVSTNAIPSSSSASIRWVTSPPGSP